MRRFGRGAGGAEYIANVFIDMPLTTQSVDEMHYADPGSLASR
jgi:hypothetical protein